jgi:hypothetical protein
VTETDIVMERVKGPTMLADLRLFLSHFDRAVRSQLGSACAYRLENRTLPASELAAIRRMSERLPRG